MNRTQLRLLRRAAKAGKGGFRVDPPEVADAAELLDAGMLDGSAVRGSDGSFLAAHILGIRSAGREALERNSTSARLGRFALGGRNLAAALLCSFLGGFVSHHGCDHFARIAEPEAAGEECKTDKRARCDCRCDLQCGGEEARVDGAHATPRAVKEEGARR